MTKKITSNNLLLLNSKHNEIISQFENNKKNVDKLIDKKNEINKKLTEYQNIDKLSFDDIMERNKLLDKINIIDKEIYNIENNIDLINYLSKTSNILFNYYNSTQNNFQNNESKKFTKEDRISYLKTIDPNFYIQPDENINKDLICDNCNSNRIISDLSNGINVCEICAWTNNFILDSNKPSYKEPPPEITYYSYRKTNHLKELLTQRQGKETTSVPQEIIDKLIQQINRDKKNINNINEKQIKDYLKILGYCEHYDHIPYILYKLNGKKPIVIPKDISEKIDKMFKEIQEPFEKIKQNDRQNFLSYNYTIHKFLEILDRPDLAKNFPLLKSRTKLYNQDQYWKKICQLTGYKFIRSI